MFFRSGWWFFVFVVFLFHSCQVRAEISDIDASSPFLTQHSKLISMDFQNAPLVDVLKIFSEQSGMNLIATEDLGNKQVTVYFDKVPVDQALEQILRANALTCELRPETNIYLVKTKTATDELETRVYSLKYASVSSSKLKQTLSIQSGEGASSGGLGSGQGILDSLRGLLTPNGKIYEDTRTNSVVITDVASNFPIIEKTIQSLDVPVPQILIEVEMLEVTKQTADLIGIKAGATPLTFTGASRSHYYPWDQNNLIRKGDASFGGDDGTAQYTAGTINASGLSATLQFLRTQTDTKNLARPRILTLNNEPAQIRISTNEAIGLETVTVGASSASTSTTTSAERVETGVSLTVTPQANLATDEITMAIAPKVTIARTGATFQGNTFRDPEERGSQSILKVKSGDTIIIGGLLRNETSKTITKIPVLGDIPFIGAAFRHKDSSDIERELIIFITPIIVNESLDLEEVKPAKVLLREQDIPGSREDLVHQELIAAEQKTILK